MSALFKAAQDQVDAENAQKYVDCARIKKAVIENIFCGLYDNRSSKILDVDAWIRKAPNNLAFLERNAAQLDSLFDELIDRALETFDRISQDVAHHFDVGSSVFDCGELKKGIASMSDQQCREALPRVIDLLAVYVSRFFTEERHRQCFYRTQAANEKVAGIYFQTAKELADKVDQLEDTARQLSSSILTMQKQASKTAAKLAKLAETVETFIGDVHFENATDPLNRLTLSLDKLLSLPSVTDSNTVGKTVYDRLLEAHDKLLYEVNCLKIGRERYRAHIEDLKAKLNVAKQPSALGKKNKKQ